MNTSTLNKYFVYLRRDEDPIPWDPTDPHQTINIHSVYFGRVFEAMEERLETDDLTFYLTWDVHELPSYGPHVVAVVLGDEWCRIPAYAHRVRAIFKCYGTRPILGCDPLHRPSYKNLLTLAHYLQKRLVHLPGAVHDGLRRLTAADPAGRPPIFDIPLGYANQVDLPIKAMKERRYDLSFAGSVVHKPYPKWSLKNWLQTPKSLSRREMIAAMTALQKRHPEWTVALKKTESYRAIQTADPMCYSRKMMDTKISLVPRGTSFETFRYFEALRYGCVVIAEALPSRWFYDGSPAIQVSDWNEIEAVAQELLGDERRMQEKHEASLHWWRTKCSETAVGAFIAEKLNALTV